MIERARILGRGFGLYGYLPALARLGVKEILLDPAYAETLHARAELQTYNQLVRYCEFSLKEAQDKNLLVVSARRPRDQEDLLASLHGSGMDLQATLLLEKPLALDANRGLAILETLSKQKINFRINYIFQFLNWYRALQLDQPIQIKWEFQAHHFKKNLEVWKRNSASGGGALRFFGTHLLYLVQSYYIEGHSQVRGQASQDYSIINFQINDSDRHASISIHSNASRTNFEVRNGPNLELIFNGESPFDQELINDKVNEKKSMEDYRVPALMRFIESSYHTISAEMIEKYMNTERLAKSLEVNLAVAS